MKIAVLVLLVLSALPYLMSWISGYYRRQQLGVIDNKNPRQQYTQLSGVGARAVAAQQNGWEALALYGAGLLAVSVTGVEIKYFAETAMVVLICRVFHAVFYLANLDILRSLSFALGVAPSFYWFSVAIANG